MKRKRLSKDTREEVYAKYNGHCAYCGKEIDIKDMQIDHMIPFANSMYGSEEDREKVEQMIVDGTIDDIDNLMPSCRSCNFYKGGCGVESLRKKILTQLEHSCRSTFQTRLAMQYGMITYTPWDGKFYFEKYKDDGKEK